MMNRVITALLLSGAAFWLGRATAGGGREKTEPESGIRVSQKVGGPLEGGPSGTRVVALTGLDDKAAFRAIANLPGDERVASLRAALRAIPVSEWSAWFEKIGKHLGQPHKADMAGMARRYSMVNDFFAAAVLTDPVGYMAAQNSKGQRNTDGEAQTRLLVMMKWAELDPAAARAHLQAALTEGSPAPGMGDAARFMAMVMARNGEPDMFGWATTLPQGQRAAALNEIIQSMADTDPAAAAARLTELRDAFDNSEDSNGGAARVAENLVGKWARDNPREALTWASNQTGDVQRKAVERAVGEWAGKEFDAALSAVRTLPVEAAASGWPALINRAPGERIHDLAGMVEALPDGTGRARASGEIMSRWTGAAPEAASAWMQRQPRGEVQDAAIERFVRWADVRDTEAGLLWAGSMSDPEKRMDAINHIIGQLGPGAPAVVTPWLEQTATLTEAERSAIREKLNAGR